MKNLVPFRSVLSATKPDSQRRMPMNPLLTAVPRTVYGDNHNISLVFTRILRIYLLCDSTVLHCFDPFRTMHTVVTAPPALWGLTAWNLSRKCFAVIGKGVELLILVIPFQLPPRFWGRSTWIYSSVGYFSSSNGRPPSIGFERNTTVTG